MSTLGKTFTTVKTLERSHLQMHSLDMTLNVSEGEETMWTRPCSEVGGIRVFKSESWREEGVNSGIWRV